MPLGMHMEHVAKHLVCRPTISLVQLEALLHQYCYLLAVAFNTFVYTCSDLSVESLVGLRLERWAKRGHLVYYATD